MTRRFNSLRELFRHFNGDGKVRNEIRQFNLAPIVDGKARSVREFAERLGFDVARVKLPGKMTGRLVADAFSPNGYRIEINETHSILAQRWAVLHEVGHYFLHKDFDDPIDFEMAFDASGSTFYVDQTEEAEANAFAAVLLFGDGALAAARSRYGENVNMLVKHFGVSERAIKLALKQF